MGDDFSWWNDYFNSLNRGGVCEYALYQHTDTPLNVIGLAIGNEAYAASFYRIITLYDSTMTELASVRGRFSSITMDSVLADTNAHHFYYPGVSIPYPSEGFDPSESIFTYVYYAFFDKDVEITVNGDYYIGFRFDESACMWSDPHNNMNELHGEPYHFASQFRYRIDTIWSPIRTSRIVPTLFAILKFPCEPVDSVSVALDSNGCLTVDWEQPALQSSWKVRLTMPDGSEIIQPTDSNHWEYCGLATDQHYTVHVLSRCDDIDGYSWSDWSDGFSCEPPQGVDAIRHEPQFDISPNPASGTVIIECASAEGTVELVDVQGRTLLSAPATQRTLDISRLSAGSYIVRLTTPGGTAMRHLQVR